MDKSIEHTTRAANPCTIHIIDKRLSGGFYSPLNQ